MNLKFFIDRPVFSIVISITIVLMGSIAIFTLPVEQYPDIAPPTVAVYTSYPGASAETVQKTVIVPLEEAINGVENMNYITSTASNDGSAQVIIFFRQGTDPDMAAVNVQNRVSAALSQLPSEVVQIGVITEKQQNSMLKVLALYAPEDTYDQTFLNNYMKINVEPRIKRIPGVGRFEALASNYSMRIWLKPDKMAEYRLVPSDVSMALARQNIEAATGSFGDNYDNTFQYSMKYSGRFSTPEEFGNIVIRALPGGDVLRLREVADIELGDEEYNYKSTVDGHVGVLAMAYQSAGSNASQIIQEIDAVVEELSADLPKGLEFVSLLDTNDFLYASIRSVIITLLEAILLVVIVVYVFIQDIKSTIIPAISIIVSIIGTFAFMSVAGFSINLLTLFALILAIGTVVDDAIIVVEAVQAKFDAGYKSSYMATNDAMKGIAAPIVTSTIIFMAVFIPVTMMGGTSGAFYTQFGVTMAVAVAISTLNALTLSPALCAIMLAPYLDEKGNMKNNFAARFRKAFNSAFDVITRKYLKGILVFMKRKWLTWGLVAGMTTLLVFFVTTTPTGLVPDEDTGEVMVSLNTRPGISLAQTNQKMEEVREAIARIPGVDHIGSIAGWSIAGGSPSYGMFFLSLKNWSERGEGSSAEEIVYQIQELQAQYPDVTIFAATSPMIPGYGMTSGFELYLQDKTGGDVNSFKEVMDGFVAELLKRPEIAYVYSPFETDFPQYLVEVDAARCEQVGISPDEVLETLSGYYSSSYVSNFNRFSKLYKVMIQADPSYRVTSESLNHIYTRVGEEMAPLSQFVTLTKVYGPETLSRFNLLNAINISGFTDWGYSSGQVLDAVKEVADSYLPSTYTYEFGGLSREESQTNNNTVIIFAVCMIMVYLVLSALYESFLIPFAVLLTVPCGLLGSFLFAQIFWLDNNIYLQTGIIMLIGLLAKTAILLTEYATKRREAGMSLVEAAYSAAKVRLRPILMTALTMIFGLMPLMVATGVGANGSRSLAAGVLGGMFVGTLVLLFIVPALFIVFQYLQEKIRPIDFHPRTDDWTIQAELEEKDKRF